MEVWHTIGRQFRNPRGWAGRVMGRAMRLINRLPNRMAIDALDVGPGMVVLEVGCGPGAAIAEMLRRHAGSVVHGLDQSAVMIRQATARNRGSVARGTVHLHLASFLDIPLPDASVDRILAVNVAYFWTDISAVLAEMRRVLKPAGKVVVYVTDAAAMRGWKFAGPATHRLYDAEALRDALGKAPFQREMISIKAVAAGFGVPGLIATINPQCVSSEVVAQAAEE